MGQRVAGRVRLSTPEACSKRDGATLATVVHVEISDLVNPPCTGPNLGLKPNPPNAYLTLNDCFLHFGMILQQQQEIIEGHPQSLMDLSVVAFRRKNLNHLVDSHANVCQLLTRVQRLETAANERAHRTTRRRTTQASAVSSKAYPVLQGLEVSNGC